MNKKYVLTLIIFLLINQQNVFAHIIDDEEQKCIAKTSSTIEMNICSQVALDSWNKEINDILYYLKNNTDLTTYKKIIQSQRLWEQYKNNEIKTFNKVLTEYSQGTMYKNVSKGYEVNIVRQRALQLQEYKNIYP